MPRSRIERIREKIRLREYDMTSHAMDEMAEDRLAVLDIENAVLTGRLNRLEKDDPRGTKYVIVRNGCRWDNAGWRGGAFYQSGTLPDRHRL